MNTTDTNLVETTEVSFNVESINEIIENIHRYLNKHKEYINSLNVFFYRYLLRDLPKLLPTTIFPKKIFTGLLKMVTAMLTKARRILEKVPCLPS